MIDILYSKHNNRTTEISNIEVIVGQKIKVLDGPLSGLKHKFKSQSSQKNCDSFFMMCRSVTADVAITLFNVINNNLFHHSMFTKFKHYFTRVPLDDITIL